MAQRGPVRRERARRPLHCAVGIKNFTADDMAREAMDGDDFALMMIERTGKYIGTGVASVINLLNIERIVLGGGVMQAGDLILKPDHHQETNAPAAWRYYEILTQIRTDLKGAAK